MNQSDLDKNKRFAELVGICWCEPEYYNEDIDKCHKCGAIYSTGRRSKAHPDFISDPRLVLREMDRIGMLDDFKKYSGVFIWMPEGHYIRVDYMTDTTTGLLVKAAIEWMEKEMKMREDFGSNGDATTPGFFVKKEKGK